VSVSGKNGTFENFDFRYADMQDCYFHEAHFESCNFTGTKIRRCNFRTATFKNCRFEYITIDETPIDYKMVVQQLPSWPNVAKEILHALRRNAVTLGEVKEVRELTLLAIEQEREHLRRARKKQEAYYNKKYGSLAAQARVRYRSFILWSSKIVWGHGEKLLNLVTTCFVSIAALSAISTGRDIYSDPSISFVAVLEKALAYFKSNVFEVLTISPGAIPNQSAFVLVALSILKIVFGGMFVAYIFRAISRR